MQERIKQLRVSIDGVAELTKKLKPFRETLRHAKVEQELTTVQSPRLEVVEENFSNNLPYKNHYLLRTDKGIYRWGSNLDQTADEAIAFFGSGIDLNSKEVNKAVDSLFMAKAWLGKMLQELGVASPYGTGYKTKEDIEPTADKSDVSDYADYHLLSNHIERVDFLRNQIECLVQIARGDLDISDMATRPTREYAIARTNCYNYLCEAKFHLGFELQRIKESK